MAYVPIPILNLMISSSSISVKSSAKPHSAAACKTTMRKASSTSTSCPSPRASSSTQPSAAISDASAITLATPTPMLTNGSSGTNCAWASLRSGRSRPAKNSSSTTTSIAMVLILNPATVANPTALATLVAKHRQSVRQNCQKQRSKPLVSTTPMLGTLLLPRSRGKRRSVRMMRNTSTTLSLGSSTRAAYEASWRSCLSAKRSGSQSSCLIVSSGPTIPT